MMDSGAPLALYAVVGAALLGSVLGVLIEKWLVAMLAPVPLIVIPMGLLIFLRPYLERDPVLSDPLRETLLEVADTSTALQMTIAAAGGALLGYALLTAARAGQPATSALIQRRAAKRRPRETSERAAAQTRVEPQAAALAPVVRTPPPPPPVFEVAPSLTGTITASSVASRARDVGPPKPEQTERRRRGRRRAILSGYLILEDGRSSPCRIADLSDTGARVRLPTLMPLPPKLWLLNASDWTAYEAALAWRSQTDAGLRFLSRRNLKEPETPQDRAMQALCTHLAAR